MEEKKLTDEEVARAILQSIEYSKTITYFDEWGNCKSIMVTDILNLIHRLQSENEGLKERGQILIDSLHKTIDEKQAEIERLTEELNGTISMNEMYVEKVKQNAELQKQVDELKETLKLRNKQLDDIRAYDKEIVKDTAKEIFEAIFNDCWAIKDENGQRIFVESIIRHIAKERYGVEVE